MKKIQFVLPNLILFVWMGGGDNTLFQGCQFRRGNGQFATGWAYFFRGPISMQGNDLPRTALIINAGKPICTESGQGRGGDGTEKPTRKHTFMKTSAINMVKNVLLNIRIIMSNILHCGKLPLCQYCG